MINFDFTKKRSRLRTDAGTEQVIHELRGDRTSEEWQSYLEMIAERQVDVLNTISSQSGLTNISFQVSVIDENKR